MTEVRPATAQLDQYLAVHYPDLFAARSPRPSISAASRHSSTAAGRPTDPVEPISNRFAASPAASPSDASPSYLSDSFSNRYRRRDLCRSPGLLISSDDEYQSCRLDLSDGDLTLSSSDQQSIEDVAFKFPFGANHSNVKCSGKGSIESKVEELLSEYRDGLESSWFRTPDQSRIYDGDSSDELGESQDLSGAESPDAVEAVWRRRRYQKETTMGNKILP